MEVAEEIAAVPQGASACPFASAISSGGEACPFASSVSLSAPQDAAKARNLDAAQLLAEKGVPKAAIARMLGLDESDTQGLTVAAGRMLGNAAQMKLDDLLYEPEELCCPVMLVVYNDPVIASDGFIYEKDAVQQLINAKRSSPMTREQLKSEVFPARQKQNDAKAYREKMIKELVNFASKVEETGLAESALERATDYLEYLKPANYVRDTHNVVAQYQRIGKPIPAIFTGQMADKGKSKDTGKGKGAGVLRRVLAPPPPAPPEGAHSSLRPLPPAFAEVANPPQRQVWMSALPWM
jgi:hypothetical protein